MARHNKTKTTFDLHNDANEENSWETSSAQDIGVGKPGIVGSEIGGFRDFFSDGFSGGHDALIFLETISSARGGKKGKPTGDQPTDDGGDPNVLSSYTSGDAGAYNIDIDFKGSWTTELQSAFIDSADFLSNTILSDISDVFFRGNVIDDIEISASLKSIDGEGGILGQAGPTAIRSSNYLPAQAVMEFDSADATNYEQLGLWDTIVLHEMLHSIGFGTVWSYQNLLADANSDNPTFTGANATLVYQVLFNDPGATGVPVEQDGGSGTALSHWDEETFDNEIMTGYINQEGNYLSPMTIASLEDLGYDTTFDAADYNLIA